jgi:hypothetical protein
MADLTRRGFLGQMSVATGVGIAGGLGLGRLVPAGATPTQTSDVVSAPAGLGLALENLSLAGPMIIHVRDVPTAEISMMVGTQELIYRDPELVSRLVNTAVSATKREA